MYQNADRETLKATVEAMDAALSASEQSNESLRAQIRNMQEELNSMGNLLLRVSEELRRERSERSAFAMKMLDKLSGYDPVKEAENIMRRGK